MPWEIFGIGISETLLDKVAAVCLKLITVKWYDNSVSKSTTGPWQAITEDSTASVPSNKRGFIRSGKVHGLSHLAWRNAFASAKITREQGSGVRKSDPLGTILVPNATFTIYVLS